MKGRFPTPKLASRLEIEFRLLEVEKALLLQKQGGEKVVCIELPNGETLCAPVGAWFLAFTEIMKPEQRTELFEKMLYLKDKNASPLVNPGGSPISLNTGKVATTGKTAPVDWVIDPKTGKRHYTMHCDPGNYAGKITPLLGLNGGGDS